MNGFAALGTESEMSSRTNRTRINPLPIVGLAVVVTVTIASLAWYNVYVARSTPSGLNIPAPDMTMLNNSSAVIDGRTTYYVSLAIGGVMTAFDRPSNASEWNWTLVLSNLNGSDYIVSPSPATCAGNPPGMAGCAAPSKGYYLVISNNWTWQASYPASNSSTAWNGAPLMNLTSNWYRTLTIVSPTPLVGVGANSSFYRFIYDEKSTGVGGVNYLCGEGGADSRGC